MEAPTMVLEPHHIESYIKELECFPVEEILSPRWTVQSCRLIQLGVQMVLEATQKRHQDVLHQLQLQEKTVVLIWELITTEAWRQKVLPLFLTDCGGGVKPTTNLPVQLVMQSEAALAGLIEALLYEEDSARAVESLVLDVIDWAVRQLTEIAALAVKSIDDSLLYSPVHELSRCKTEKNSDEDKTLIIEEIKRDAMRSTLVCGMRAVGLLQQISLHRKVLPLCAGTRLLQTHDVPQLVATLLEYKPWQRDHEGTVYFFEEGQWMTKTTSGFSIPKAEVQMWLILFSLLLDCEDGGFYEITSARRTALLKIQTFLTDAILLDIPALQPLSKYLSSLTIVSAGPPKFPSLVTTLPQIGETPVKKWEGRWNALASLHQERALRPTKEALLALASRFAVAYDLEALEFLLPQSPTCATCGEPAGRRCSRCRTQWYCRRSCQVSHWKKHKSLCDLVSQNSKQPPLPKVIEDISN